MSESTVDGESPAAQQAVPVLDERHNAMLAAMGVNVWWHGEAHAAAEAVVAPVRPAAPSVPKVPTAAPVVAKPPVPVRIPVHATAPESSPLGIRPIAPTGAVATLPLAAGQDWETLAASIRACVSCDLGRRRQQAVPGMGDTSPDWLIVGEAPGEEEDRQGLPFVGRAGQLLDRMLAAMALSRQHKVYIANVIKCRPPHNRNPDPVEIAHCMPYLLRQIELLQPRIVLAMGRFAAHTLLAQGGPFHPEALRQLPLGKLRGRVHRLEVGGRTIPLVVTYHPAFLLRSPSEKAKAWADLCLALDAFGQAQAAA